MKKKQRKMEIEETIRKREEDRLKANKLSKSKIKEVKN